MASCLHLVDFSKDELFELHVAPQFWKFLFDQNVINRNKVSPISRLGVQNLTSTKCVRIAFDALFEMGIPFEFGAGGDPITNGTPLATSQKEKIDVMQQEMWDESICSLQYPKYL